MTGRRFEGRNLDDALENAAREYGVERYQLSYHVVLEKRGFLGGTKRIVIEAAVDESKSAPESAPATQAHAPSAPPAARPARPAGRDRGERQGRGRGRDDREPRGRGERGGRDGRGDRGDRPRRPVEPEYEVPDVTPEPQGPESEAALVVRRWCEELIALGGFALELRTTEDDHQVNVMLFGRDAGKLVANGGELLDSWQVIANKALVGRRVEKPIELDAASFKSRRSSDLEQRAKDIADRVRESGTEQLLPPMSPVERRIVHVTLQDDADVTTESRGDGFYKRVAIMPRSRQDDVTGEP